MKHWLWLPLVGLLLAAPWASTSPTEAMKPMFDVKFAPFSAQLFVIACNGGGERSCAIVATTGREQAVLGLYVYDPHGNCVALDEFDDAVSRDRPAFDQAAIEWFPPTAAPYTIEVRNMSGTPCTTQMAIQ
jgi:hypothetical protein